MTKRKVKNSVARPRLPKTRRRECPVEEPKTFDLQANLKDIVEDSPPQKESTVILAVKQQKTEHQSLVSEGVAAARGVTDVSAKTTMATVTEVGTCALNNAHAGSQPEHLMVPMNNNASQDGDHEEAAVLAETDGYEPRSSTDPVQATDRPLTAFEEQREPNECSYGERIQRIDQHNRTSDPTSGVSKARMETQVFPLPAKKKPLIEIFDKAEEMPLAPARASEFFKIEDAEQTTAGGSDGNDGIQAKVHGILITLDEISVVVDPTQEDQSHKVKDGVVHIPQESLGARSDPGTGQEDQERRPLDGDQVQNLLEKPSKGVEGVSPLACLNSISLKNQAAENSDATKAAPLLANGDTNAAGENRNNLASVAGEGSSLAMTCSAGCTIGPTVPSFGSGKQNTLDAGKDTRSSFLSTEPCRMKGSTVLFGAGYLDYVSDSQLNAIPLIEEEIVKGEKDLGSPDCPDGTDLISGLIKELSWLNWKVMATHRELENMRRNTKSLKSSTR